MRFFRCYSDSQYTTKPGIKQPPRQKFSVYPAGRTGMVISVTNFSDPSLSCHVALKHVLFGECESSGFCRKGLRFFGYRMYYGSFAPDLRRKSNSNEVRYAAQSSFSRADVRYLPRSGLRHALRRLSGRLYLQSRDGVHRHPRHLGLLRIAAHQLHPHVHPRRSEA